MATVQLAAGSGIGGLVQGNFGVYQEASDGTFTVDARDAPSLLTQGFGYVKQTTTAITLPLAPAAASIGATVASGALSNGSVSVTANPDTMRPVNFEWGTGTTAITAGTATITYIGNDGASGSDTINLGYRSQHCLDCRFVERCYVHHQYYYCWSRWWHFTLAAYEHNGVTFAPSCTWDRGFCGNERIRRWCYRSHRCFDHNPRQHHADDSTKCYGDLFLQLHVSVTSELTLWMQLCPK